MQQTQHTASLQWLQICCLSLLYTLRPSQEQASAAQEKAERRPSGALREPTAAQQQPRTPQEDPKAVQSDPRAAPTRAAKQLRLANTTEMLLAAWPASIQIRPREHQNANRQIQVVGACNVTNPSQDPGRGWHSALLRLVGANISATDPTEAKGVVVGSQEQPRETKDSHQQTEASR